MKKLRMLFLLLCISSFIKAADEAFTADLERAGVLNNPATQLHSAAAQGDVEKMGAFLEWDKYIIPGDTMEIVYTLPIDSPDETGRTPLMQAAQNGKLEAVRYCVDHGADVNATTKHNWTPLHYATTKEIALLLLQAGALKDARNKEGHTPEDVAYERKNTNVVAAIESFRAPN